MEVLRGTSVLHAKELGENAVRIVERSWSDMEAADYTIVVSRTGALLCFRLARVTNESLWGHRKDNFTAIWSVPFMPRHPRTHGVELQELRRMFP